MSLEDLVHVYFYYLVVELVRDLDHLVDVDVLDFLESRDYLGELGGKDLLLADLQDREAQAIKVLVPF